MRLNWKAILVPGVLFSLAGYFGYHMMHGGHGIKAWSEVEDKLETNQQQLAKLKGQQDTLEHQVALLRPESLDPDLLEEQARKVLGLANPNEIVVLRPEMES